MMSEEEGLITDISPIELESREMVPGSLFHQQNGKKDNFLLEEFIGNKTQFLNQFSVKMFKVLPITKKNHVICPINVFSSFAILYLGSNGNSMSELKQFLGLENLNENIIFQTIKSVLQVMVYEQNKLHPNYYLSQTIHMLIDQNARYLKKFELSIKRYFNVKIDRIDFEKDADLIERQMTELSQSELNTNIIHSYNIGVNKRTQIVIMSTVRFLGKWDIQLPFDQITNEYFYSNNEKKSVQMMSIRNQKWSFIFVNEWDSQVVELPFARHSLSFILIVPQDRDGLNRLLNEFSFESLSSAISGLQSSKCDIFLPKFKLECDYDFAQLYEELTVFKTYTDLIQMGGKHPIKANNVLHKVIFEINDNGIKPPKPSDINRTTIEVRADHPFLFVVKDNRTQSWTFLGKVQTLG